MMSKDKKAVVVFWKSGAGRSLDLAKHVFEKKHYDHALFCGHLALEKILKAMIITRLDNYPPHSHDLMYLAGLANIDLTPEQQQFLTEVSTYNIAGRYPEEKLAFYKKVTRVFAQKQLKKIHDFYLWLSKQKDAF